MNKMKHVHINTKDLRWAIGFAGAFISAKTGVNKQINKPFTVSFERTCPEIELIADHFHEKPLNAIDFQIPKESEFEDLDLFFATNQKMELEEQHGVIQDLLLQPLTYTSLASVALLKYEGIINTATYWFPKLNKNQLKGIDTSYNGLIECEEYGPKLEAFMKGRGFKEIKLLDISKLPTIDVIKMLFSGQLQGIAVDITSSYISVLRSQYRGFDYISENIPVLAVVDQDGGATANPRLLNSWGPQVPIFINEPLENLERKGQAWAVREKFGFDHHAWERALAKQK